LRPCSTGELKDKFKLKGYPPEVADKVMADLAACGMLDDAAFARAWMQSRLKKYGFRRVARELADKGIAKELVSVALGIGQGRL